MNRKKELNGSTTTHPTQSLNIDTNSTLSQLKNIFVAKEDLESFRKDQDDRLDCISKAVAKVRKERSEILEKFLKFQETKKAARRERCW